TKRGLFHGCYPGERKGPGAIRFQKERVGECQGGELNSRPRAYESPALPLSYPGVKAAKLNCIAGHVNATGICSACHSERTRGISQKHNEVRPANCVI